MAEKVKLIDASKLLGIFCADCGMRDGSCSNSCEKDCAIYDTITSAPTVEAQPVKHGRWIYQGDDMWLCSNCKENIIYSMHKSDRTEKQRYCCRCGARMDGDSE